MATIQQNTVFNAKVDNALDQLKKFIQGTVLTTTSLKDLEAAVINFNTAGQKAKTNLFFEGMTEAGQKVTATMKEVKGAFKIASVDITKATEETATKSVAQLNKLDDKLKDVRDKFANFAKSTLSDATKVTNIGFATGPKGESTTIKFESVLKDGQKVVGVARDIGQGFVVAGIEAKTAKDKIQQIKTPVEEAKAASDSFGLSLAATARVIEATAIKQTFTAIKNAIIEGTKEAVNYQIAISEIRTISQDNQLSFAGWGQGIRKVSDLLGIPAAEVAAANYEAVSNQVVKGAESFEFLAKAGELARVSQASLKDSVNVLSSVINAYGLSTADTEKISASFFRTVDLGRVRLSELGNTYGRVAFLGNDLGVSFDEINAALATLTIQGVKTSDAQTLVVNVMQKLLRPTERMKDVFKSFGVESGQAAVQTFGFAGVLERLFKLSKQGNVDAGELFNEIRGRKGFEGLTNFEGQFKTTLKEIQNSVDGYKKAITIRAESPGDFLVKEVNKIKNIALVDIGQNIINTVGTAAKSLKGLTGEFELTGETARRRAVDVIALTGTITVVAAATQLWTARTVILSATLTRIPIVAAIAGVGTLVSAIIKYNTTSVVAGQATLELEQKLKDQAEATSRSKASFTTLNDTLRSVFQNIEQPIANVRRLITANLDSIDSRLKIVSASIKSTLQSYLDDLQSGITQTGNNIRQAQSALRDARDGVRVFKEGVNETIFQSQLSVATQPQQRQLIAEKIKRLRDEAAQLARPLSRTGDPNQDKDIAEQELKNQTAATQKLNEAVSLVSQDYGIMVDLLKQQAAVSGRNVQIQVESLKNNRVLQEIVEQKTRSEEAYGRALEANIKRAQEQKKAEEDRQRAIRELGNQFSDFSLTEKDGGLRSEFKDRLTGKIDVAKAEAALTNLANRLQAAIGNDAAAQVNLLNLIGVKRLELTKQIALKEREIFVEQTRKGLEEQKKLIEGQIKTAGSIAASGQTKLFGEGNELDKIEGLVAEIAKFQGNKLTLFDQTAGFLKDAAAFNKGKTSKQLNLINTLGNAADDAAAEVSRAVSQLKENAQTVNGVTTARPEDVSALRSATELLKSRIAAVVKARGGSDDLEIALRKDDGTLTPSLKKYFTQLDTKVAEIIKGDADVRFGTQMKAALADEIAKLGADPKVKILQEQFGALADPLQSSVPKIQAGFGDINNSVDETIKRVDILIDKLRTLDFEQAKKQIEGKANPRGVEFKAQGGIVGLHPGAPRGTDTIPAWLTAGERVLTVAQNAQYEKMITMLRPFTPQPRYYAQGGVVNETNVGDIHISVSGAKGSQPLEEIAQGLRRRILRGGLYR